MTPPAPEDSRTDPGSGSDDPLFAELRSALDAQGAEPPERVPARFSDLRLLRRGGQGTVYRAFDRTLGRTIALKLLGNPADSRGRARLEREIEFLRQVEHPGVVRVLDGGTEEGVLFLALELVEGEPLNRWAERRDPPLRLRLEVAAAMADAVDAAHRRGVLHRDLKPSNVLVDAGDRPRVLDFGIARSLGASDEDTGTTRSGGFSGTLAYTAPERLQSADDATVDTRSDVYSLAVMVYELLCGSLPYPVQGTTFEVQRSILEHPPFDPQRVAPGVPKDVATILLRALSKDPERRTPSARAFADDLRRFLSNRPIEARRDHVAAVLWRWMRRHPGLAGGLAVGLVGVTLAVAIGLRARLAEEQQRHTGEQLRGIFQDLLAAATTGGMTRRVGLLEVFEDVARRIDQDLGDAPDAQAAVQLTIGETYLRLLLRDEALPHLRAALERYREHDRKDRLQVARCLDALGRALAQQSRPEAIAVQREALALHRAALGEHDVRVALSRRGLAEALLHAYPGPGEARESPTALLETALADLEARFGPDHAEVAATHTSMARDATRRSDPADAVRHYQVALDVFERVAPDDTERLRCLDQYAHFLRAQQRYDEAEQALERSIQLTRRLFDDARVVEVLRGFANLHHDREDYATSERFSAEALALELDQWVLRRPDRAPELRSLSGRLRDGERERPFADAFEVLKDLAGPGSYEVAQWMNGIALLEQRLGRGERAEALLRSSLTIGCRHFGADCPVRVRALETLAAHLAATDRVEEALPLLEEAVATRTRVGTLDQAAGQEAVLLLARSRDAGAPR